MTKEEIMEVLEGFGGQNLWIKEVRESVANAILGDSNEDELSSVEEPLPPIDNSKKEPRKPRKKVSKDKVKSPSQKSINE